jgi:N-succinyldiaminopimelate aminotransferase
VGGDDERFTAELFAATHITVVPGSYLARRAPDAHTGTELNPGAGYVRISLVAPEQDCVAAAIRIRDFIDSRK